MYTFGSKDQQTFWEKNRASYHGSSSAPMLIFLTAPFIGPQVLDAGAGDGSLLRELRRRFPGIQTVGVDIAPKHPDILTNDLKALSFKGGCFDTVFCSEVIEHLGKQDTLKVLRELKRVLKPSGSLILTVPFEESLREQEVCCPSCGQTFHRWGHQQSFTVRDFEALAQSSGLAPLRIFPVKYSRVRRFRFLGRAFFWSRWWAQRIRRAGGKRNLVMVAVKR